MHKQLVALLPELWLAGPPLGSPEEESSEKARGKEGSMNKG